MGKNLIVLLALAAFAGGSALNLFAQAAKEEAKPAAKNALDAFTPEVEAFLYYSLEATSGADKANAFDNSRTYIGGKYALSDNLTFRYVSDIGHETGGGKFEVFAKYAYLDWKLNNSTHLIFGLQGSRNWSVDEKEWGYRGIRKTPMESFGDYYGGAIKTYTAALDSRISTEPALAAQLTEQKAVFAWSTRDKMGSSADQAITLSLKPNADTYLDFMVLNGSGYKKAEDDKYKNIQVRAGRYLSDKAVHLSGYFEIEPWSFTSAGARKSYTNAQWDLLAAFTARGKGQFAVNYNGKRFAGSYEDITAGCFSVFGSFNLGRKNVKGLARLDYYKTGLNTSAGMAPGEANLKTNATLFILGVDFMPNSHVHIIPDVQVLSSEDSAVKTSNILYLHVLVSF